MQSFFIETECILSDLLRVVRKPGTAYLLGRSFRYLPAWEVMSCRALGVSVSATFLALGEVNLPSRKVTMFCRSWQWR